MLTFLVAILVILFLGSAILDAIANALSWTAFSGISLFKLVKKLKIKVHDKRMRKQEREVNVNCPCSNTFRATPKYDDNWMVNCPACGCSLRVDISRKKKEKNSKKKLNFDTKAKPNQKSLNKNTQSFKYSDEQKIVLFLDWCNRQKESANKKKYPEWLTNDLCIKHPNHFHKDMIKIGYLTPAPELSLNKLKVSELKDILIKSSVEPVGKKADLIQTIILSVDIKSLNLPIYYKLSEKSTELIEKKENKELLTVFHNGYQISVEEFYEAKKEYTPNYLTNDIFWSILNKKHLNYTSSRCFSLARNICLNQANLLEDEGKYPPALEFYIKVVYYDLSGCDYFDIVNKKDFIIKKEEALVPCWIVGSIQNLSEYFNDTMIENCKKLGLPHQYYSIEEFRKIIKSIIDGTDYYLQFVSE